MKLENNMILRKKEDKMRILLQQIQVVKWNWSFDKEVFVILQKCMQI